MKNYAAILTLSIVLTGCGGGDSSSGGGSDVRAKNVDFTLNAQTGVSCPNADDASVFQSGDFNNVSCTWFCANYKGRTNIYVSLDFQNSSSTDFLWVLDSEFISDGICN